MKTIVGVASLVFAMVALFVANFLPSQAEADLLDKRPDLSSRITMWQSIKQYPEIRALYQNEFPNGKKFRQSRMWLVAAALAFLLGLLMLVEVK